MTDFYASVSNNGQSDLLLLQAKETGEVLETLHVVQANDSHRAFILSTWVRSYEVPARLLRVAGMPIGRDTYHSGESRVAERHWRQSKVVVGEDGYTIHAWLCGEHGKLWHVYVPPKLRRHGIAKCLTEHYCGKQYEVSKPWPSPPRRHVIQYNPYMNQW